MFEISFVNFLQISLLTLSVFGISLLLSYPRFRQIRYLLVLVSVASIFNLLEELHVTREYYLVTPAFILGFGPAIYLAIKGFLGDELSNNIYWHYLPMLLVLPFTHYTEVVIAIGTVWRVGYAYLSIKRLIRFRVEILEQRSDASELSMKWLELGLFILTVVSIFNLVRLNFQPFISHYQNVFGQGISTAVSVLFIAVLIRQLLLQKSAVLSLESEKATELDSAQGQEVKENGDLPFDDVEYFNSIFSQLKKDIYEQNWYKIPRLTLLQLSELSGLQTRDISRAINVGAQQNFNDYINQLRLEYVKCKLMQANKKSILELAMEAGFNSKSNFNLVFKRHFSMTPNEFRNTRKK